MTLAASVERYLGGLEVTQGAGAGEQLQVFPWERRFLRGALKGGRRTAALSIARGNGKTTLTAGIATAAVDGPLAVRRGEVVIVASSYSQARIGFEHVIGFMGSALKDRSTWRVLDNTNAAVIEHRKTGARVRALASDPRRLHGLAPSLVLADEPAQWAESTRDRVFAALRTALGKIPSSRFWALGTRPAEAEHFFTKLLDGGADYSQEHRAPEGMPVTQRQTWLRANPSLPYMPDLEAAIRAEAIEAVADPSLMPAFEALRLNRGVSDVGESLLADAGVWRDAEGEAEADGPFVLGLDMGATVSWTAGAPYWPSTGRLEAIAVTGSEPDLGERARRDGMEPEVYRALHRRGELLVTPGRVPDPRVLFDAVLEQWGLPSLVVCDRWRLGEVTDALTAAGLGIPVATRGQGFKDGGEDVRLFRRALLAGRVTPVPAGLLPLSIAEARTQRDPAGNEKLVKRRSSSSRDDAAAAAVLAVAAAERAGTADPAPVRSWAV